MEGDRAQTNTRKHIRSCVSELQQASAPRATLGWLGIESTRDSVFADRSARPPTPVPACPPPPSASPYAVTSAVPVQRHGNRHIRAVRKSQEYATSQDEAYHLLPRRNERLHHPQGALGQPGYTLQNAALLHQ